MYKKFFGLHENPFNVNPDPRYLYLTRHIQEALACLIYGIQTRKGFVLLTGEVGTGKTTVLNKLLEWSRQEGIATAFMFNPRLSEVEFFDFMLADFGIPSESTLKSRTLLKLNQWLLEKHGYVKERLRIAGNAGGEIFSPAAIEVVHRHAAGIPRIINLLCEHALISAFVEHSKTVSEKMVEEVAGDFDLREANREAPKAANSGGHPVLVDHPVPQNVKPSSMSFTKAAGEKKS